MLFGNNARFQPKCAEKTGREASNDPIFFRIPLHLNPELGKRNFTRIATAISQEEPAHFGRKQASKAKSLPTRHESCS